MGSDDGKEKFDRQLLERRLLHAVHLEGTPEAYFRFLHPFFGRPLPSCSKPSQGTASSACGTSMSVVCA